MASRPPAGLGPSGRALWRSVLADFELSAAELRVLAEAARTADEVDRLRRELTKTGATVDGSRGQPRANPLWSEVRAHRLALARLLAQLQEER